MMLDSSQNSIEGRYLLTAVSCPCYVDAAGRRYLDPMWAKDLAMHTAYIEHLTLAAPRIDSEPPVSFVPWDAWPLQNVNVIDLPPLPNLRTALFRLPKFVATLWAAVGRADVVHSGVAGWPIADAWVSAPLAKLRKKFLVIIVESDFWRISEGEGASPKRKLRAAISEMFSRWCVNAADAAFFTQETYLSSLLTHHPERGHVIHASWVDDSVVLPDLDARSQWDVKLHAKGPLRLGFVGRLVRDKGILLLLEALALLRSAPGEVCCDIIGDGPLMAQCQAMAAKLKDKISVRFFGTLEYGDALFDRLSSYDALVVPSVSNEQPRIVYDAYARGIGSLAFETEGLASCIRDGVTGRLCAKGSPRALGELIDWSAANRPELARMGMAGLSLARSLTHREMHRRRCEVMAPLIAAHLRQGATPKVRGVVFG